ncbi:hypothetical protein NPIL_227731 [Nephila pilipes]|uniref:Uncharacterized protein n=1 Tax=Nephila pilipes TaxID=299642 RepID=A0A8X6I3S2_NEPPI|nr:hypothetical protein NPIL_227731 [Nephila pilipes]
MKPDKCGYKFWYRGDMTGYINEFDAYQGKEKCAPQKNEKKLGLGGSVIKNLKPDSGGTENKSTISIRMLQCAFDKPVLRPLIFEVTHH